MPEANTEKTSPTPTVGSSQNKRPNILFILADQLRAASLPLYGETQIATPNIDKLARGGVTLANAISSAPVCTPYRSMLLTGRHPQTTGHLYNFVRTRHDEIGIGDVFSHAGYRTGWVGKWHLYTGDHLHKEATDYVPEGRDRLGFEYWRGYNFHMNYFNGTVNMPDGHCEPWKGYETEALDRFALGFLEHKDDDRPFCLFVSPHQPHFTFGQFAPENCYDRLPEHLTLPANVPESAKEQALEVYRHYLAMTLALDDMVGGLLDYLDRSGQADNTLVIFTSDHGTMGGAHGIDAWAKKLPYEESIRVPWIMRWPGVLDGGARRDALTSPVDILPSLCALAGIPIPRTVEGCDLSEAWKGAPEARERDDVFMMNFSATYNELVDGNDWRGARTKDWSYARWVDGRTLLYDLRRDPLEMENLAGHPDHKETQAEMERRLSQMLAERGDRLVHCTEFRNWFDAERGIVRNAFGPLGDPMAPPDWSRLS